jgi:hypothetical protein
MLFAVGELRLVVPIEYRADAVVVFTEDKPVFGAFIEAQLQTDGDKLSPGRSMQSARVNAIVVRSW